MRPLRCLSTALVVLGFACGSSKPTSTAATAPDQGSGEVPPAMAGTRPEPFTEPYPSMEKCLEVWTLKRGEYDKLWGPGSADNGAAYWRTETENIELACNPVDQESDSPSAEMFLRYSPLEK